MSTVEEPLDIEPYEPPPTALGAAWNRVEALLERGGERLNPILIKEARQALKSKQFTITFALVLAAGWVWSFFGLALAGPAVYYSQFGTELLYGYFVILIFALVVIVPYTAFRSLASELEDHTYELLAITTLKARQIVGGKLASACLQMLIFLSALSPCIAFTYLLRGIDLLMIGTLVLYSVLASVGLSLFSLLLATCAMERYRQVVASVMLVLLLGWLFVMGLILGGGILQGGLMVDLADFLIANLALLTGAVSSFVLIYLAAAAQLSFPSSNRSTAVRVTMVVQQALFCGWMAYAWFRSNREGEALVATVFLAGIYWYFMGVFLTGEPAEMSPRVKRDLPQSFLGRTFLTWFNPGPGSGYLFVLANFLSLCVLALLATPFNRQVPSLAGSPEKMFYVSLIGLSYLAIYLGLGKLILTLAGRVANVSVVLRMLVHFLLLACGTAIPTAIQISADEMIGSSYSLLQITNPLWTMVELAKPGRTVPLEIDVLRLALPTAALLVLGINMPAILAELRQTRIARPARVVDEDAELAAAVAPAEPVHTNPWD